MSRVLTRNRKVVYSGTVLDWLPEFLLDLLNVGIEACRCDVEWAVAAGRAGAEGRDGVHIEAAGTPAEVMVNAYVTHLGRPRRKWAQVRVPAWDGSEDRQAYIARSSTMISERMARKLAERDA